jgi:hypothetical protein
LQVGQMLLNIQLPSFLIQGCEIRLKSAISGF